MRPDVGRRGRGCLIALIVCAALASAIGFIGIPILNNTAEGMVDRALQEMLRDSAMASLSYQEIAIETTRGRVVIQDASMPVENAHVNVTRLSISVDPKELIAYGLGRSEDISKAEVEIEKMRYETDEHNVTIGSADIICSGSFNLRDPASSFIREILVDAVAATYSDRISGLSLTVETVNSSVRGKFTVDSVEKEFDGLLDDIGYIDLKATDGVIIPDEHTMAQLGMFVLASPWIADAENWRFNTTDLEARILPESVKIDRFSIDAPLLVASGTATLPKKEAEDIAVNLHVSSLNNQVREELNPIVGMLGQRIPENEFAVEFAWRGQGLPRLVFH